MVIIEQAANKYRVLNNGEFMGTVALSRNPHHQTNCYVKLELNRYTPELSRKLFARLKEVAGSPLQAMAASEDAALTAFLSAGGFLCKRKCYEVEAGIAEYVGGIRNAPLRSAAAGTPEYEQACRQMYAHYVATHKSINPWTDDYEAFCKELPEIVLYAENADAITSCAFVEGNEIAYVCGKNRESFKAFAQNLITFMLSQHKTLCFESDDCDWPAMTLRSLFHHPNESSYDTYIYSTEL